MRENESLGHMKQIREIPSSNFFTLHHYVAKMENSKIGKFREVFDASCKSSSGVSLNELMHNGPTVQPDLFAILLRFRLPKYVFSTDVEKMYVDTKDQMIMWRENSRTP